MMSKVNRLLLGIATVIPLGVFIAFKFISYEAINNNFLFYGLINSVGAFIGLTLIVFYIAKAVINEKARQGKWLFIWIVLFLVVGVFSMPIYWYLYIWREQN